MTDTEILKELRAKLFYWCEYYGSTPPPDAFDVVLRAIKHLKDKPAQLVRSAMIKLVCRNCKRTIDYGRDIAPSIPPNVARIEQPHCDQCWNGEREGETWYDGAGREVAQS